MPILVRGGVGWGVIHVPARGCLDALFTAPSPSPESSRTTSLLKVTKIFLKVRVAFWVQILFLIIDSKTLTEEQREELFDRINQNGDFIGWAIEILSPNYLSTCMLRRYLQIFCLIAQNVRTCKNNGGGDDDIFPFVQD